MSMASTDEEVELRDLVAECESLAQLSERWEATQRASERFKRGEDTGSRLDRKPARCVTSPVWVVPFGCCSTLWLCWG